MDPLILIMTEGCLHNVFGFYYWGILVKNPYEYQAWSQNRSDVIEKHSLILLESVFIHSKNLFFTKSKQDAAFILNNLQWRSSSKYFNHLLKILLNITLKLFVNNVHLLAKHPHLFFCSSHLTKTELRYSINDTWL